ncbi:hypothetical protein FBY03_101349 [Pseudomonas sp. SJZ079]|uniref:co-regulatory protein PtrA N-terminal domain-containing protein n=1 Tax=Pseudomonas sp. SJZ079 TaxID=2572887 RepID=UPI00119B14DF|nr:co-regulatory protein PtrA N-terminal domain-containing protein [Pseudomonas sp. SJZ079]TWC43155.1 hypothetical protein FBY03_101349 [Pseudomonas sp. SJZ079]
MKSMKTLFVVAALSLSSLALAEGGAERTLARVEQAQQVSSQVEQVAQAQKREAPSVKSQAKMTDHASC